MTGQVCKLHETALRGLECLIKIHGAYLTALAMQEKYCLAAPIATENLADTTTGGQVVVDWPETLLS
jgi:hypothetical protein